MAEALPCGLPCEAFARSQLAEFHPKADSNGKRAYTTPAVEMDLDHTKLCSALRKSDHRKVCIKKLRLPQAGDELARVVQDNEAVMSLACSGGANTLTFHHAFKTRRNLWIVMDFVEGTTLRGLVEESGPLVHEPHAAFAAKQILLALRDLHRKHRAHRDVKPENLLVCEKRGAVFLMDFGWAIQFTQERPTTTQRVGTLHYMAPEVLRQDEYALEADVWSLGVTVVELMTGQPPHFDLDVPDAVANIEHGPAPTLPSKFQGTAASAFVAACLQKDPAKRPSCEQLLQHPFVQGACDDGEWACLVHSISLCNVPGRASL